MNPLSEIKRPPNLQDFDGAILKVNAYFDAHPIVPLLLCLFVLVLIFLNAWSHWRNR